MSRTLEQIKQDMISTILSLRSDIKLVEGDTQHDVVVSAPAKEFYKYELLIEFENRTKNLDGFRQLLSDTTFKTNFANSLEFKSDGTAYTITDVNTLISNSLDAYIKDWNITRSPGSAATGFERVFLSNAATVSWNNSNIFTSSTGATYSPSSSVSNTVPNFSALTGQYYVDIPITANNTGAAGNAIAGTVKVMSPKPGTFSYCTNQAPINGGTDSETDADLIIRAQDVWSQRVNGNIGSVDRIAGAQSYVSDVFVTNEDNETENVFLGSVCDVWALFRSVDSELIEEYIYWPGIGTADFALEQFDFVFKRQPVVSTFTPLIFKYDFATGLTETPIVVTSEEAISVVKDTNTFQGSVKAMDSLRLRLNLDTYETYARKLKVLYITDNNPRKLQNIMDNADNRMIGPSVLVKNAIPVPLRVIVEITVSFGYDVADVQSVIISNLQVFFNGGTTSYGVQFAQKKIGEDISNSDISALILRTDGVVSYNVNTFRVINTVTAAYVDPTIILANQYATLYDVQFQFNSYSLSNFTASA